MYGDPTRHTQAYQSFLGNKEADALIRVLVDIAASEAREGRLRTVYITKEGGRLICVYVYV